ncbi:MAG: hypothetical protein ACRCVI_01315 [Mycoplasmoidaceae bacterium]
MKYKIINHDIKAETIELLAVEILKEINISNSASIICSWYALFEDIYSTIFNLNYISKEYRKNLTRGTRKKLAHEYRKIKVINMYDFIGTDNIELLELSTYRKFKMVLDREIEFASFRSPDLEKINSELLINPSNFDRTIKSFTNGRIGLAIVYINRAGEIPYIENYVENIGTNLTSLDEIQIEELKNEYRIKIAPEQTINCGNRCLTKSHKIIALIEAEALQFLTNDDLENSTTASIKTLRQHDNVIYIVKSW